MPFRIDPYKIGVYPFSIGGYFPDSCSPDGVRLIVWSRGVWIETLTITDISCMGLVVSRQLCRTYPRSRSSPQP